MTEDIGCGAFAVYHLHLTAEVEMRVEMNDFKGSALRGAWESHLRTMYCDQQASRYPGHSASCPVCYILGAEADPRDNCRPYAFEPPLVCQNVFDSGERFGFGISVFGEAHHFVPYIISAVQQMGMSQGIGKRVHEGGRRGTFRLSLVEETNRLTLAKAVLYRYGDRDLSRPSLPVTSQQVSVRCERLLQLLRERDNQLELDFLTPTRIISGGRLVRGAEFTPLLARLVDRVSTLRTRFSGLSPLSFEAKGRLLATAVGVECVDDRTMWHDARGLSSRLGRVQPLGGFVGQAVYRCADWSPFLPWLVWGCSTHVGKNTVKGEGWYQIREVEPLGASGQAAERRCRAVADPEN